MDCQEAAAAMHEAADDALVESSRKRLLRHLSGCGSCKARDAALRQGVRALASLPRRRPGADFDRRVLAALGMAVPQASLWMAWPARAAISLVSCWTAILAAVMAAKLDAGTLFALAGLLSEPSRLRAALLLQAARASLAIPDAAGMLRAANALFKPRAADPLLLVQILLAATLTGWLLAVVSKKHPSRAWRSR